MHFFTKRFSLDFTQAYARFLVQHLIRIASYIFRLCKAALSQHTLKDCSNIFRQKLFKYSF